MSTSASSSTEQEQKPASSTPALVAFSWTLVGIPLVYGLYQTVTRALTLFTG